MTERTEEEKARRKEAHRVSMVASGGLFVFMALSAGYVFFSKSGLPSFIMGKTPAPPPRVELPAKIEPAVKFAPWGPAVVAEAKKSGKPILLSLYARWNYGSRLMDFRGYSDPKVAAFVAEKFVAARADADLRPDAVRRYLAHGWPTTAVLLPNGQILDTATYMEPEILLRWLQALSDGWEKGRARAEAAAAKALEERAKQEEPRPADAFRVASRALDELKEEPGRGPRFPYWRRWRLTKEVSPELAFQRLRENLALEDKGEGGFFRYAAGPAWANPEPEKSFDDQYEALRALEGVDDEAAERTSKYRARHPSPRSGARKPETLLDDALLGLDALISAKKTSEAADAAMRLERAFMDEKSGALFDRAATGELPAELDRLLEPSLNFEAWRLYDELVSLLKAGDPRRERLKARAAALEPWLLARAPWLDPAERLVLGTRAQRSGQP